MEGVVPVPTDAALVIVLEHPSKSFNVGLPDLESKLLDFLGSTHEELLCVVSYFVPIDTHLDRVNILSDLCIILGMALSFQFFFDSLFSNFTFLLLGQAFLVQFVFETFLGFLNNFIRCQLFHRLCSILAILDSISSFVPSASSTSTSVAASASRGQHVVALSLSRNLDKLHFEELFLELGDVSEEHIDVGKVDFAALVGQVSVHRRQEMFVDGHDDVEGAFSDLQRR